MEPAEFRREVMQWLRREASNQDMPLLTGADIPSDLLLADAVAPQGLLGFKGLVLFVVRSHPTIRQVTLIEKAKGLSSSPPRFVFVFRSTRNLARLKTRIDRLHPDTEYNVYVQRGTEFHRTDKTKRMENDVKTYDVFMCYNMRDKNAVHNIATRLEERGLRVWRADREIRPGQPWVRELEDQIGNIKSAVVFIGPHGIGPWQELERTALISALAERDCPVIPVFLPGCEGVPEVPLFLRQVQTVDFRTTDPDPLDQLVYGITGRRDAQKS